MTGWSDATPTDKLVRPVSVRRKHLQLRWEGHQEEEEHQEEILEEVLLTNMEEEDDEATAVSRARASINRPVGFWSPISRCDQ